VGLHKDWKHVNLPPQLSQRCPNRCRHSVQYSCRAEWHNSIQSITL